MKKALTILLALVLVLPLPFSCDWVTGNYGSSQYRIQRIGLETGIINEDVDSNRYNFEIADANDTLSSEQFAFRLFIDSVSYISFEKSFEPIGIFNAASADPAPPTPVTNVSLISIYSSTDLTVDDVEYKAGENLTPIFLASSEYYYRQPQAILSFIDSYFEWNEWNDIMLHFDGKLHSSVNGTFTIKVTMDDGAIFDMESEEVILK